MSPAPVSRLPGSSPLARGPHTMSIVTNASWGLIPARAGTTSLRRRARSSSRAHPRSRGDHNGKKPGATAPAGSSPLARGPRNRYLQGSGRCGLIPARAGTTERARFLAIIWGAHPRSRGDHPSTAPACDTTGGSSPLARGPPRGDRCSKCRRGLIPARAGTTKDFTAQLAAKGAHPRSRGDHLVSWTGLMALWGSSPLARGPRVLRLPQSPRPGLIPARAGTTRRLRRLRGWTGAHPRSRGDHRAQVESPQPCLGSSPLARGPREMVKTHSFFPGLIPARAGTTEARHSA